MRLARFCFILTVFCVLAGGAYAQTPVDPKVIINKGFDPVDCPDGFICYDGTGPLVEDYNAPSPFIYTGENDLDTLTVFLQDIPPPPPLIGFQCQTDIWRNCVIFPLTGVPGQVNFVLSGGGPIMPGDQGGTCSVCVGHLSPGDTASFDLVPVVSATPEPASVFLFGTGLLFIAWTAKRRLRAQPQLS